MKQTDHEADEALAHIRRNTAVPIQRFFDSIAAARLEETTSRQNKKLISSTRLGLLDIVKGLRRLLEALSFFRKRDLSLQSVARVVRRIRRGELTRKGP